MCTPVEQASIITNNFLHLHIRVEKLGFKRLAMWIFFYLSRIGEAPFQNRCYVPVEFIHLETATQVILSHFLRGGGGTLPKSSYLKREILGYIIATCLFSLYTYSSCNKVALSHILFFGCGVPLPKHI